MTLERAGHTEIPVGALALAQLRLELLDPLPQLVVLAGVSTRSGRLALESSVLFLNSDEVEDDVEDSRKDEGEEEG